MPQAPFGETFDLYEVGEWLPATVPGDIRLDLLRAGRIPDPFYGMDNQQSQWVDGLDWWYLREIDFDSDMTSRRFLVFEGIDYLCAVFWDGQFLGKHEGMFSRQIYEIPSQGSGVLAIRIWGSGALPRLKLKPAGRYVREFSRRYLAANPAFPDRLATFKCQMSYGWDFAPRLRTFGIWDDAFLIQTGPVFVRDAWVKSVPDGRVVLEFTVDAAQGKALTASVKLAGHNFRCDERQIEYNLEVAPGVHEYAIRFRVDDPHLWNPWDRGEPNLYELQLSLIDGSGVLDSTSTTFGIRTIELTPNPGAPADEPPWTFTVNGAREFIRGANWVPADSIPARVGQEKYEAHLRLARGANVNLLRVWGGGLREKRAFYDLCDEQGILVWQEFPFSGAPLDQIHRDDNFLSRAKPECTAIVRGLRNHPSLVLWCGGNEFSTAANAPLVKMLRETVALYDGTRPFKPASPSEGEHHNWKVWHWWGNTRDYRQDDAAFFGEFGLQAPPGAASLRRFIPRGDLYPPGLAWEYHKAELGKLERYARSICPEPASLEELVSASQEAQLRGLQVMIEHARRRKGRVSGCAFWQFDEPWPAITWALVDYWLSPKPAYFKVKELYNPLFVSFEYPLMSRSPGDSLQGTLWLINDTLDPVHCEAHGYLNDVRVLTLPIKAPADCAVQVANLNLTVRAGENALRFEVIGGDQVLCTNEYDLNYCDRGEIGWFSSLLERVSTRLKK